MGFWSRITQSIRNLSSLELFRQVYGGRSSAAGVDVNPGTAMQCAAVYACVRVLAESVAQLPLPVYRRLPSGGRVRSFNHPLASLLDQSPNEWQTAFEFREMLMGHLCLRGNAFAYISRMSDGRIAEMLPLNPDRMAVTQQADYSLIYQYTNPAGDQKTLSSAEVWHLRGLSSDGISGLSPIRQASEAIGLSLATERHGAKLFANGAMPSGVLKHPKTLSSKAIENLKQSFEERYSGAANAHRPLVLEEGSEWAAMGMTSEDSQFLQTRKYQRSEIASIFRVPPHKIGDLERATFSNIEQQSIEFVTDSLLPWLRRWEQAIARDLIDPAERPFIYAEHLVDGLLRGDIASRYTAYATGRQNGWLSANDIRSRENMNPIDGGDVYLVNGNMVPAAQAGVKPPPPAPNPAAN